MCFIRKSRAYFSQVQISMLLSRTLWTMTSTILCFFEEKPPMKEYDYADAYPDTGDVANVYFIKEATFLTPHILVGEKIIRRVPQKCHLLSPVFKDDKTQFLEDSGPAKKLKSNLEGNVIGDDINMNKLSEEFSAFESQMKPFQTPYLDGNRDASSVNTFLNGDSSRDGGNELDVWSFDDVTAMFRGIY